MTNGKIASTATPATPYTMTVNDMFTLMPYENSLVVFSLNGPQLKTILERAYRNYWYYTRGGSNWGGYSHYTTCMLDINAGGIITYTNDDPLVYTTTVDHVGGLSFGNTSINFLDATTYYTVSTVNYIAAGSCNFNTGGANPVTIWPLNQIVADTQNYVRDVVIQYIPTLTQPISPAPDSSWPPAGGMRTKGQTKIKSSHDEDATCVNTRLPLLRPESCWRLPAVQKPAPRRPPST